MTDRRNKETLLLGTEFGNRMSGLEGMVGIAPNPLAGANPYSLDVQQTPAAPLVPGAGEPPKDAPGDAPADPADPAAQSQAPETGGAR